MNKQYEPAVEMVEPFMWAAMAHSTDGTERLWVCVEGTRKPKYFPSRQEAMAAAEAAAAEAMVSPSLVGADFSVARVAVE